VFAVLGVNSRLAQTVNMNLTFSASKRIPFCTDAKVNSINS
jgi:hypothetical protein